MSNSPQDNQYSQFLLYRTPSGDVEVDVFLKGETVWLNKKELGKMFGIDRSVVSKHLSNIFNKKELKEKAVSAIFAHTASDGKDYKTRFYNLDVVISVGYRINSVRATQFRIWATKTLRTFVVKGYVLDEQRLKNGHYFGKDYFEELLEKIREIRASERRFHLKLTDLFAACSSDYDRKSEEVQILFSTLQNKLHWAITEQTAAEIVAGRVDAKKTNMGLTNWKNSPKGKILKSDVSIAKNYLSEEELKHLNRIVNMYLDYAENQAQKQILMTMQDWIQKLDSFLQFNEYAVLKDAGKISQKVAKKLAEKQYDEFRVIQDQEYISDFDKFADKQLKKPKKGQK